MESFPEGHLSESEVASVLEAAQDAGAVLIGGQSVAILGRRYRGTYPEICQFDPLTSADVDFYGNPTRAEIVASRFKEAKIFLPLPFDDATPNSAQISAVVGRHKIIIDFMGQIIWVDGKDLQSRFLTLTGSHPDSGEDLRILCLHPLDCLANRLGNINILHRRDSQAIRSAAASIIILEAFIDEILESRWTQHAQKCLVEMEHLIRKKCINHPSFLEFGLDPTRILERYVGDGRLDVRFREKTLGNALARVRALIDKRRGRPSARFLSARPSDKQ